MGCAIHQMVSSTLEAKCSVYISVQYLVQGVVALRSILLISLPIYYDGQPCVHKLTMKRAWNNLRGERSDPWLENSRTCAHSSHSGSAAQDLSNNPSTAADDSSNEENAAKWNGFCDFESTIEGDGSYECGLVDCLWPCQHHIHSTMSRDFLWMPNVTNEASAKCRYCSMFEAIAKSYCADHRPLYPDSIGAAHPCKSMRVHFEGNFVAFVQLMWSCGGLDLELGLGKEAEQGQWHSNIAVYMGLADAYHRSRLARSSYTDG